MALSLTVFMSINLLVFNHLIVSIHSDIIRDSQYSSFSSDTTKDTLLSKGQESEDIQHCHTPYNILLCLPVRDGGRRQESVAQPASENAVTLQ